MTNNPSTGDVREEEVELFSPHNPHAGKTLTLYIKILGAYLHKLSPQLEDES
jgi:hypothetical protein